MFKWDHIQVFIWNIVSSRQMLRVQDLWWMCVCRVCTHLCVCLCVCVYECRKREEEGGGFPRNSWDKLVSPRGMGRILARRRAMKPYLSMKKLGVRQWGEAYTWRGHFTQVSTVTKHVIVFQSPPPSGIPGTEREYPCAESRLCISERVWEVPEKVP